MASVDFTRGRRAVYRFLSSLLRDEISRETWDKLRSPLFISALQSASERLTSADLNLGFSRIASFLKETDPEEGYNSLRYEYADVFLNCGDNPTFPYASAVVVREPLVSQEPLVEAREAYRRAGVHKNPSFLDLDDHIAVELDFMAYLCGREIEDGGQELLDQEKDFIVKHLQPWSVEFAAVLAQSAQSDFYRGLAEITLGFLFLERKAVVDRAAGRMIAEDYVNSSTALASVLTRLGLPDEPETIVPGAVAPEPAKMVNSHCYICGSLCGVTVKVKDGILESVAGLKGDPKSDGRICPKGANVAASLYSAYRLKAPLIKENGRFRKASWDEALDKVVGYLKSTDPHKVAVHRGNDWNNWLTDAFIDNYGAHKHGHRCMCDNATRIANEHNLNDKRPWIHYGDSDYIVMFGINDLATSYGQRKTAMLKAAINRGAKLVVFDPRRCETAAVATEWVPVIPATDGAVAVAMAYVIVKNGLYNKEFVEEWTYGFEAYKKRLLGEEDGVARTPEWAEKISGVPASTIERIALELAAAKHPGVISWCGVSQSPNAFYGVMALQSLNGLLGTFDAPGGPSLPFKRKLKSAWGQGQQKPPANKPGKMFNFPMWGGWASSKFIESVESGQITGMINYYGDPVLSYGNQDATVEAFKKLDFLVTIDAFMCNTAVLSDVVLPESTYSEQTQMKADWLYEAFIAYYAQVVKPMYDTKPTAWIFIELAKRMGREMYFPWVDIEDAYRNQLAGTPWSFDELKEKGFIITDPHEFYKYKRWNGLNPPDGYGSSGKTKTGKYNFVNPVAEESGIDPLPDYKDPKQEMPELAPDEDHPLILGYFRVLEHEHSSTFNNIALMRLCGRNPLWINVLDARKRGIESGTTVEVTSPFGKLLMPAHVTWFIRQGVVGATGGFGHWRGLEGDPKYPGYGGVNVSGIGRPNSPEKYGGTNCQKYIKVQVSKKV
jgi:thiosulfate reductase/polysulfide reductase chain A